MQRVDRHQRKWRVSQFSAVCCSLIFLAGCSTPAQLLGVGPGDAVDAARNADFVARYPNPSGGQAILTGALPRPEIFPGGDLSVGASGKSTASLPSGAAQNAGTAADSGDAGGIEVNFEAADIQTVAKSILSDTLGLNVVIDPRVQGTVTLVSASAIPRKDLFAAFESVMRMSNAAVIRDGNLVKIVPLPEAVGAGGKVTLRGGSDGFGVTIVPLRFTSAAAISKAAENFVVRPGALRADPVRNMIMVQGTAAERQSALDLITSFDVEWLRNQSVGIYPLKSTSPDTMIHELQRVFETAEGGQGQGLIAFQPIARMNAVMAVAHNRKYLDQATQWIRRLDRSDTSGTTIRIYRLEQGNALKIAKILNDIFVGKNGSASASDSAASQVSPGTNAAQSKLDALGGGANGSNNSNNNSSNNSSNSSGSNALSSNGGSGKNANSFDGFADSDKNADKKDSDTGSGGSLPKGVFQNVRITADTSNNSVVIYSNQEDYAVIERSLRELDRAQLQVEIEATIAEVTLTDDLQYGVQYYLGSTDVGAGGNNGSISLSNSSSSSTLSQTLPGLNVVLGSQSSPHVVISALSQLTSVKVLSAPSLVVTDNQPAFLQVGDSVPVETASTTVLSSSNTVTNSINYQDTGVILKVWPHIHGNGTVNLEIEQEVSGVVNSSSSSSNLNPTISQRRVHSTVLITSGQTVLLGGLMSEETDKTMTGIPVLRQIKGLGDLFGTTNGTKTRTEIIVFVRPRIIQNSADAQNVAEEFRAGLNTMHSTNSVISGRDATGPLITK